MYRVLLPDGRFISTTKIDFLFQFFNENEGKYQLARIEERLYNCNCLFIYSNSNEKSILISGLIEQDFYDAKSSLLEKGYLDLSNHFYRYGDKKAALKAGYKYIEEVSNATFLNCLSNKGFL